MANDDGIRTPECACHPECSRPAAAWGRVVRGRARAPFGSGLTLVLGILAALVPKCPMCVAAYLSLIGLSATVAGTVAPLLLPVGVVLIALSLSRFLVFARRATRARPI